MKAEKSLSSRLSRRNISVAGSAAHSVMAFILMVCACSSDSWQASNWSHGMSLSMFQRTDSSCLNSSGYSMAVFRNRPILSGPSASRRQLRTIRSFEAAQAGQLSGHHDAAPETAFAGLAIVAGAPATRRGSRPACPALLQHTFPRLQDEKPQSLCQYSGRVLLVVNTASYCGFTPQYEGLEKLHARYRDRGLVVLGFPSNDFAQEKGSNKEIADFCENTFGVKFPMFGKTAVRGATPIRCSANWRRAGRAAVELPQVPGRARRQGVDSYSSLTSRTTPRWSSHRGAARRSKRTRGTRVHKNLPRGSAGRNPAAQASHRAR